MYKILLNENKYSIYKIFRRFKTLSPHLDLKLLSVSMVLTFLQEQE